MNTESVLDKPIVLCLNKGWQRINYKSVKDAIVQMNSTKNGVDNASNGMVIDYPLIGEDTYDFERVENMYPIEWDEWINLPIRPFDNVIHCSRGRLIRVPTVIIARKYDKMPKKQKPLSHNAIHERDGLICQYSGKKLTRDTATVDHVIPRDVWLREGREGSPDTWENMVTCEAKINHEKGNRLNEQIGLKLLRQPKAPPLLPMSSLITEIRHRDWQWFMG